MVSKLLKTLTLTGVAASMATAAFAADITLRATANSNENDEDYDGLVVFKNYVEAASNGAIAVELFIGTQLCSKGAECLQGVADGSIDVYISTSGGAAGIFPYVQVLDLPYLMANDRIAEDVLTDTDFTRTLRAKALADSDKKIRLMTVGNTGGWRNFADTKRRVAMPKDMEGLKIRTVVADLPQELVKALGASPTPIPWPELFTSFQTGVVEGSKNGITDIMGMKFPDAGLKYVTLDGHAYMGALWWMNNDKFSGMSAIQAYQDFVAGGGELDVPTPAEKAAFKEAATPVFDWFKSNVSGGEEVFNALTEAVAQSEAKINAAADADINCSVHCETLKKASAETPGPSALRGQLEFRREDNLVAPCILCSIEVSVGFLEHVGELARWFKDHCTNADGNGEPINTKMAA